MWLGSLPNTGFVTQLPHYFFTSTYEDSQMHYYQFNIADYRKDTVHLSPIEHYIYRSLIDTYYLDEKPICENKASILRKLSLDTVHEQSLTNVLDDFFNLGDCGYEHKRIDEEMDKYQSKAEHSRANGKLGGRPKKPRKTQPVILGNPEEPSNNPAATQTKANQEPITNNHKPITKNQKKKEEALPLSLNMNAWDEFVLHRTQINKPMKALAKTKAVNILKDLPFDQQQNVVDYSIAGGYTGLFANQSQNNRGNGSAERVIPEYIPESQRDGISVINSTAERVND